jgi:hypothetical protein
MKRMDEEAERGWRRAGSALRLSTPGCRKERVSGNICNVHGTRIDCSMSAPAQQYSRLLHPRGARSNRLLKFRHFAADYFRIAIEGDARDVEVVESRYCLAFQIVPLYVTLFVA